MPGIEVVLAIASGSTYGAMYTTSKIPEEQNISTDYKMEDKEIYSINKRK